MSKRLFVLDPDLLSPYGHNYETSVRVARSGGDVGFCSTIVANEHFGIDYADAAEKSNVRILTFFSKTDAYMPNKLPRGGVKTPLSSLEHHDQYSGWEHHLLQLLDLDRQFAFTPDDVFYVHTLTCSVAVGWLNFFRILPVDRRPKLYCLIYSEPKRTQGHRIGSVDIIDIFKKFRSEGLLGASLFFHVETSGLRKAFMAHGFDFPVFMGPIPGALFAPADRIGAPLTISYLGEAREEKGFHLIPDILGEMVNMLGESEFRSLRVLLQISTNEFNLTPQITRAKARLRQLASEYTNIRLLDELSSTEYQKVVEATDLMLLAYDGDAYRVRGSGVAFEGLASGKCLITTPDIDINETFPSDRIYVAEAPTATEYAAAIVRWFGDIQEGRKQRWGSGADYLDYRSDNFFTSLFKLHDSLNARHGPRRSLQQKGNPRYCLYFSMADYDGGLAFVQRAHWEALRKLGFTPIVIAIPWYTQELGSFDGIKNIYLARHLQRIDELRSTIILAIGTVDDRRARRFDVTYRNGQFDEFFLHRVYCDFYDLVCCSTRLIDEVLIRLDYEFVFTNYSFTLPLAQRFTKDRTLPLVFESHDNHSHQNALRRRVDNMDPLAKERDIRLTEEDLAHEISTADRADVVLHISSSLESVYARHTQTLKQQLLRPFVTRSERIQHVPREVPLFELIQRNNSMAVSVALRHLINNSSPVIDLFFYGSHHPANNASLKAFLTDIFVPYLIPKGLKLYVAGGVCDALAEDPDMKSKELSDHLVPLGKVDKISDFLLAARVVVLYVTEGTGFPTKVIETLSAGQAFSINDRALCDLAESVQNAFPFNKTPQEMAADILDLLSAQEKRTLRGEQGLNFYEAHFSEAIYLSGLKSALQNTLGIEIGSLPVYKRSTMHHVEFVGLPTRKADVLAHCYKIEPGVELQFDKSSGIGAYLSGDWSYPEDTHTWIMNGPAGVMFAWPDSAPPPASAIVDIDVQSRLLNKTNITIRLNGVILLRLIPTEVYLHLELEIPHRAVSGTQFFFLEFESSHAVKLDEDPRYLSLSVIRLNVLPGENSQQTAPVRIASEAKPIYANGVDRTDECLSAHTNAIAESVDHFGDHLVSDEMTPQSGIVDAKGSDTIIAGAPTSFRGEVWTLDPTPPGSPSGKRISMSVNSDACFEGWNNPEVAADGTYFRWMKRIGHISLPCAGEGLSCVVLNIAKIYDDRSPAFSAKIDGHQAGVECSPVSEGYELKLFPLHRESDGYDGKISILTIESAVWGSPKSDGTGLDDRTLSAIVRHLEIVLETI